LPGGSGLELMRRLKREDLTRDMPVIMLTAKTTEDNVIQGLDIGADDYLTKPFAPPGIDRKNQSPVATFRR